MSTEAILTLTQWLSPAYPVGAFAYSHGLEAAADAGQVINAETLRDWLETALLHGAGWNDGLFLAAAYRAPDADALAEIDATARAFAASKERLMETGLQGDAFGAVTDAVWHTDLATLCYPVAVGRAAAIRALPQDLTATLYLQAFSSNLIAAGQRLLPIGQTEAQRLLRALMPLCIRIAADTAPGSLDQLGASAFLGDIAAMRHEIQHSRIFRT